MTARHPPSKVNHHLSSWRRRTPSRAEAIIRSKFGWWAPPSSRFDPEPLFWLQNFLEDLVQFTKHDHVRVVWEANEWAIKPKQHFIADAVLQCNRHRTALFDRVLVIQALATLYFAPLHARPPVRTTRSSTAALSKRPPAPTPRGAVQV